jgi:hypothetical protein
MPDPFLQDIIPTPQPEAHEMFAASHVTREFYREVQHRADFEEYCLWYRQVAEQHRRELSQMRKEINFFGWFNLGRKAN